MGSTVIRKVDISDPAVQIAIKLMHEECYDAVDNPYTPTSGDWWVAFEGKTAAAFAGIQQAASDPAAGYLCRAGVLPEWRGAGLQKRLIQKRVAFARARGWTEVITDTNLNPASANSLIACGFRMYSPSAPWSFATACYWRKSISQ